MIVDAAGIVSMLAIGAFTRCFACLSVKGTGIEFIGKSISRISSALFVGFLFGGMFGGDPLKKRIT